MNKITLLTVSAAALVLSSCTPGGPDCPDVTGLVSHYEVELSGIESILVRDRTQTTNNDAESIEVSESNLFIDINLSHTEEPRYYASSGSAPSSIVDWFIKPAMACSPLHFEDEFTPLVTSVTIHSDSDFNESFIAGSDLSSLFKESYNSIIYDSLSEANIGELNSARNYRLEPIWLTAEQSSQPVTPRAHIFTISVTLNDGRSFEMRTQAINITDS